MKSRKARERERMREKRDAQKDEVLSPKKKAIRKA